MNYTPSDMTDFIGRMYPKRNYKTAHDWHVYYVFHDEQFVKDCILLEIDFIKTLEKLNKSTENSLDALTYDEKSKAKLQELSDKYAINTFYATTFIRGLKGAKVSKTMDMPAGTVYLAADDGPIIIELQPFATQKDFLKLWKQVEAVKKNPGGRLRMKPPRNTQLIYAVFKARKAYTFPEIFELYKTGKLPYYDGPNTSYKYHFGLERFYDRYRPDKTQTL